MKESAYILRTNPGGEQRIDEFKTRNIAGIGWIDVPDLTGKTSDELREIIRQSMLNNQDNLRNTLATFKIFLKMKAGDYIVSPEPGLGPVHIARVTGDYRYEPDDVAAGFPHQRTVEWLGSFARSEITDTGLIGSLRFRGTAANISAHVVAVKALLGIAPPPPAELSAPASASAAYASPPALPAPAADVQYVTTEFPLRPGVVCRAQCPADMTEGEAKAFGLFVSRIYYK